MKDRYKRLIISLVILLTITFVGVSLIPDDIQADINAGSLSPGGLPSGGGSSTGGGGEGGETIAFGYRISFVDKKGKRLKYDGTATHSVDYWQRKSNTNNAGLIDFNTIDKADKYTRPISGYDVFKEGNRCHTPPKTPGLGESWCAWNWSHVAYVDGQHTKQEISTGSYSQTISNFYPYPENNKADILLPASVRNVNFATNGIGGGMGPGNTNAGNYITYHAMNALVDIFTRAQNGNMESGDYETLSTLLKNSGFNSSKNNKTNVDNAIKVDAILQLEPVSALLRSSDHTIYVGTSADQAIMSYIIARTSPENGGLKDYNYALYLHPIIYAARDEEHDVENGEKIWTKAGIALGENGKDKYNNPIEVSPTNAKSVSSPLAVALYRLSDYFKPLCDGELITALEGNDDNSKKLYEGLDTKYTKEYEDKGMSEKEIEDELYFVRHYTYAEAKFYYKTNKDLKCNSTLECQDKAKAIYNACSSNPNKPCTVGDKEYDNYEDALINNSNSDTDNPDKGNLITKENYYKNQWNITYMKYQNWLTANFRPTSCKKVTCDQTNVDLIFQNKFNRNKEYKKSEDSKVYSYDEYFDWLQKATGSTFLSKDVWYEIGKPGPECEGTLPDCPGEYANKCNDSKPLVVGDNTSNVDKCWKNGVAYTTTSGVVGSFVKALTSSNSKGFTNSCRMFCNEQVTFNLPNSPTGPDGKTIRAGTIFKWGNNLITKNKEFGSMTITKQCIVKPDSVTYEYKDKNGKTQTGTDTSDCTGMNFAYPTSTWNESNSTHFKLVYKDPTNTYQYSNSDNITMTLANSEDFRESRCTNQTCSNLTQSDLTTSVTYNLSYSNYLNWYADKSTGEPKAYRTSGSTLTNLAWYKWIGYGLPTSFMTPNGTYGQSSTSDGKLALEITNVGTPKNGGARFDKLVQEQMGSLTLTYSCPFTIINELFGNDCKYDSNGKLTADSPKYCDEDEDDKVDDPGNVPGSDWEPDRYIRDIDVVFRVIDLISPTNTSVSGGSAGNSVVNNAFPGIDGTGRIKGRNWDNLSDSQIEDILNENVYNGQPMYSLELNTANIRYIRQLNRDARSKNIDPYSEMRIFNQASGDTDNNNEGYTGYYCVNYDTNSEDGKDTYKYCASRFLSLLANDSFKNHGGAKLEGSCFDNVGRNSTAKQRATYYSRRFGCQRNS